MREVHNKLYLLRKEPLLVVRTAWRWVLADHHGHIMLWGGLGGTSPFRDMASLSRAEDFGNIFLHLSRFDAKHLFDIWNSLASRRDQLFVDNGELNSRIVISRVAQLDSDVAQKFVGKKLSRPPPILDSGLFDEDLHNIYMVLPVMHDLHFYQRQGLDIFLKYVVPKNSPHRGKFLTYLQQMVTQVERGEITASASSFRRYVGEYVCFFVFCSLLTCQFSGASYSSKTRVMNLRHISNCWPNCHCCSIGYQNCITAWICQTSCTSCGSG